MTTSSDTGRKRRPVIGFLVDSLDDPYQQSVFEGVGSAAEDCDIHLVCFDTGRFLFNPAFESSREMLGSLIGAESVDGLLLLTGTLIRFSGRARLDEFLRQHRGLPLVSLSEALTGIPSLTCDNRGGIRDIVRHLVLHHHLRGIAFVGGPSTNQDAQERYRAFLETMAELDVPFDPDADYVEGDFTQESGRHAVATLLSGRRSEPGAIVAANDDMAVGAIDALLRCGLRVPRDVAVCGFDDVVVGKFCSPPLTSVAQDLREQGYRGVETLVRLIRGEQVPELTVLPTRAVIRESCGCYSESIRHVSIVEEDGDPTRSAPSSRAAEILVRIGAPQMSALGAAIQELTTAFQGDLSGTGGHAFLDAWERTINDFAGTLDSGQTLQKLISELRRVVLPCHGDGNGTCRRGESLLHQARVMLGELLLNAEKRAHHQTESERRILNALRDDLLAVFDEETLADSLARSLPRLGIGDCCIARFQENGEPGGNPSSIVTMSLNPSVTGGADGKPFPSRTLIPRGIRSLEQRSTWVVETVAHFECMGHIMLRLGTRNYQVYGEIRGIVSNTMQGVRLLRQAGEQNEKLRRGSEELKANLQSTRKLMGGVFNTLYLTVETRDPYTAGHEQRVADLARCIATAMGLSSDQVEAIRLSSSVHDLGKLYVPSEILNKPGQLRDAEFSLIKLHPEIAYDILKTIDFPWPIADIVVQHHERMDGSGYPARLSGDQVKIEARIIGVADAVEAMASHRPYRPSLGLAAALAEIQKQRGRAFDAAVVDACLDLFNSKGYAFRYDGQQGGSGRSK